MLTSRELPYEEWSKMPESLDPILMALTPGNSRICVVEEQGAIVGYWLLVTTLRAHCIHVDESRRKKTSVLRRLLGQMRASARAMGFDAVVTAADDEQTVRLMSHPSLRATVLPGLPFVMPVED